MTYKEFHSELNKKFTVREQILMTFCILYHPDHVEYFHKFRIEQDYEYCLQYLKDNRKLLNIKNVEKGKRSIVKKMLKNAKRLKNIPLKQVKIF